MEDAECSASIYKRGPTEYFQEAGFSSRKNVITKELEQALINRIFEIVAYSSTTRMMRRAIEQPVYLPMCVNNREINLVSTESCRMMKELQGKPLLKSFGGAGQKVAWMVDQQNVDGFEPSSLEIMSNGTRMPDVTSFAPDNHYQNLDNVKNRPFIDLEGILRREFGHYLINESGRHLPLMTVQIVIADKSHAKGMRGHHLDPCTNCGSVVIGTTLLHPRSMLAKHLTSPPCEQEISLPRGSSYLMFGAFQFGCMWEGVKRDFHHGPSPFVIRKYGAHF